MNNLLTILAIIVLTLKGYTQNNQWEIIPLPAKSTVDIMAQLPNGLLFGQNTNGLGNVVSYDNGLTWEYLNHNLNITKYTKYSVGFKDDLYYYRYPNLIRYNLKTGQSDTVKLPENSSVTNCYPSNFNFGMVKTDIQRLAKVNTSGVSFFQTAGIIQWVGTSAYSDIAYIITKFFNNNHLYRINSDGSLVSLGGIFTSEGKFFLHKNTIIRNTEYSLDEGKTWNSYNLPFSIPDTITTYKGNLAFVKGDQLFYLDNNQTTFSILNLPPDTGSKGALFGQTIVLPFFYTEIKKPQILRSTNGIFEPIEFNLESFITKDFVPTSDGGLIASDENYNLYYKKRNSDIWNPCLQNVTSRVSFVPRSDHLSVNKKGVVSVINLKGNLLLSYDEGATWSKQTEFDSLDWFNKQELYNGTYITGTNNLRLKSPDSGQWVTVDTLTEARSSGFTSNAEVVFTEHFGAEMVYSDNLRKDDFFRITDIDDYQYLLFPHYEMKYIFNLTNKYIKNTRWKYDQIFSQSYDNGATFDKIEAVLPDLSYIPGMYTLKTGHFLILDRKEAYLSDDYGKSWNKLNLTLNDYDFITGHELSIDNYLYIKTAEKGILRNGQPLPQANIVRIQLLEDQQVDCLPGNDENPLEGVRLSMGNDIHQLTNHEGRASFYSFDKNITLFVDNEAGIFDFCQDTMPINFEQTSGSIKNVTLNGVKIKDCADLDVKFITHQDSLRINYTDYRMVVRNNGNVVSEPTKAVFTFDPGVKNIRMYDHPGNLDQVDEWTYHLDIESIQPGEVKTYQIVAQIDPEVSYDQLICASVVLDPQISQCIPVLPISVCRYPEKSIFDKTVKIRFYHDSIGDCIKNPSERYLDENINICADSNDMIIHRDSVLYYVTQNDTIHLVPVYNKDLYELCDEKYTMILPDQVLSYQLDIPVKNINKCPILYSSIVTGRYIRCFDTNIQFYLHNRGNKKSNPGVVKITLDPYFLVNDVAPSPFQINDKEYLFYVGSLEPGEHIIFNFACTISCDATLQQEHCHRMEITENNPDCNLNIVTTEHCNINGGSYDPNDKTIFVSGKESVDLITADDAIEYRIRFQNTGTDTAYTVRIQDYLSPKFDVASIQLLHSTHVCTWKVDNRVLIVDFPDIDLVDSFTNVAGSQGEIRFSIALLPGREIGDKITNQANIFFDFNEPVATNNVVSTFGKPTQVSDQTFKAPESIGVNPNPVVAEATITGLVSTLPSEVYIYNNLGQLMFVDILNKNNHTFKTESFVSGMYQIVVKQGTSYKFGRFIKL